MMPSAKTEGELPADRAQRLGRLGRGLDIGDAVLRSASPPWR